VSSHGHAHIDFKGGGGGGFVNAVPDLASGVTSAMAGSMSRPTKNTSVHKQCSGPAHTDIPVIAYPLGFQA